jgi:hypothetical protein
MLFGQAPPKLQSTIKPPQVKWVWKLVMNKLLKKMITWREKSRSLNLKWTSWRSELKCNIFKITVTIWWRSLRREKSHQRLLLNHQRSKFKMRMMKRYNMQGVSSLMQECHMSRVGSATKIVISTTLEWTQKVKNSSSSPRPMSNKRRSKTSRPQTIFLILMLMLLICYIMILMFLMYLWEIRLVKLLLSMLGHTTRDQRLVCGCQSALLLTWEDPTKLGYLKQKPNLFCRLASPVVQVVCSIVDTQIIWPEREGCSHHLRRMSVKMIASRSATIAKAKFFVSVKLLLLPNIQFLKFFLLSRWTTIYCLFPHFVRRVTIICSPMRVWLSLGGVMIPLYLKVSWEGRFTLWISSPRKWNLIDT